MPARTIGIVLSTAFLWAFAAAVATVHAQATDAQQAVPAATEPTAPVIHPEAQRILKETTDKLAAAKTLSFKAEIWNDQVLGGGHKLCTTKTMAVKVRRPNGLAVEIESPKRSRTIWYDGKTATLLDRRNNVYGSFNAPATIDQTLDAAADKFGITIPLDDLIVADPYTSAIKSAQAGAYFGKVTVVGVPCRQIAFSTPAVDWQLWVEDGGAGLPRKVTITYRQQDTQPQFTAIFSDWTIDRVLTDDDFAFTAPQGAVKTDMKGDPSAE